MNTTTVTIKYANGEEQVLSASEELEARIAKGEMFSASSMHPDHDAEGSVAKLYVGNPMVALGNMLLLRHNIDKVLEESQMKQFGLQIVSDCIGLLTDEISALGSNLSTAEIAEALTHPVITKEAATLNPQENVVGTEKREFIFAGEATEDPYSGDPIIGGDAGVYLAAGGPKLGGDRAFEIGKAYHATVILEEVDPDVSDIPESDCCEPDCHITNSHCDYYGYQLDSNDEVAIDHCCHPENPTETEGNCTTALCPLGSEDRPIRTGTASETEEEESPGRAGTVAELTDCGYWGSTRRVCMHEFNLGKRCIGADCSTFVPF